MIDKMKMTLANMLEEIPGVLTAAVVAVSDGLSIVEGGSKDGPDTAAASAYLASIVKSNLNAINLLAGDQITEDILVTTNDYYFIIRHLPNQPFFIFLMTNKDSWLGKARVVMKEYDEQFQQFAEFLAQDYMN